MFSIDNLKKAISDIESQVPTQEMSLLPIIKTYMDTVSLVIVKDTAKAYQEYFSMHMTVISFIKRNNFSFFNEYLNVVYKNMKMNYNRKNKFVSWLNSRFGV